MTKTQQCFWLDFNKKGETMQKGLIFYKRKKLDWQIWDNSLVSLKQARELFKSDWYREKDCIYAWGMYKKIIL